MKYVIEGRRFSLLMRRYWLFLTIIILTVLIIQPSVQAAEPNVQILIDGSTVNFPDAQPFINSDGRTMVPIRFVAEQMSCNVNWDGDYREVGIFGLGKKIVLRIESPDVQVNDQKVVLDTKPIIKEDRTYVPLRFISEAMGTKVDWDETKRIVKITNAITVENNVSGSTTELPASNDAVIGTAKLEKSMGFASVLVSKTSVPGATRYTIDETKEFYARIGREVIFVPMESETIVRFYDDNKNLLMVGTINLNVDGETIPILKH